MATQVNATRTSTAAPKTVVLCIAALAAILMMLQLGGQVSTIQSPQIVQGRPTVLGRASAPLTSRA